MGNSLSFFPPFFSDQDSSFILWCYTGGGHFFEEIFDQIRKINQESVPICFLFSNAGALVANRYGFFWKLIHSNFRIDYLHFIFEKTVAQYNIQHLLQENKLSFTILSSDPAFSIPIALANSAVKCIIAGPLTANTAAKLVFGIADSIITNVLSTGLKSKKKVAVLPTDALPQLITTKLPIRQIKPTDTDHINPAICKFHALREYKTKQLQFLPQFCVGCKACVKKFPDVFSYGEVIEVEIREADSFNIQKLKKELTVFRSPSEIYPYEMQFYH